jgi:hypothetical protein
MHFHISTTTWIESLITSSRKKHKRLKPSTQNARLWKRSTSAHIQQKREKKNLPRKLILQKHRTVTTQENTHQKCSKNNNNDQIHKNPMRNKLAAAAEAQLQTLQQQQQQQQRENQYISSQRNYKRNTKSNPNPTI